MTDKGLNLFDDCAAECVYLCPRRKSLPLLPGHSKMCTPGTIASWQTNKAPTKIIKNGAVVKVRILVELGILQDIKDI